MDAAEEILNQFHVRFILEMDASSIALDLLHHGIIPDSVLESTAKANGQNFETQSFMTAC